ncbi:unnamed protein product [Allacma fusca]|uniref:BHLH domain-containing protein n=1 Tax=Allacma fusca TaxID=39272 RepID=A0A8J2KTA6_9HEXA|nr:unnamed protein product [Allacma fusca]
MPVGQLASDPDVVADTTRRVKVLDSRRKQRWVEPQTRIPPTPPRSPLIPEPILDDLLELWSGLDEPSCKQHDISLHSALDSLEFIDDFQSPVETGEDNHGDLEAGTEDEDLLDHLLRYTFDDSPPPTNPASPRETETEASDPETDPLELDFLPVYSTVKRHEEEDTDMELEEFDRYPKTEPITSEFTSQIFDNYFTNMIVTNMIEDSNDDSNEDHSLISYGKGVSDGIEIKHDCMWAGSCQSDTHQELFEELLDNVHVKSEYDDDYDITSSQDQDDGGLGEELEEESNLEVLRNTVLGDHSYAFNGVGPVQQHQSSQPTQQSNSAQTQHAIQGILLKEEQSESSPKKTKILVPLKDLMETLQQKSFLVAPLGPGKKVIRLTGNGETVKGVLDLGAQFKSASSSSVVSSSGTSSFSCSSSLSVNGGKGNLTKKPASKMKKAIHKPKQELSPSSPIISSRHTPSSSHSSNSLSSCSSSNSSSGSSSSNGSGGNSPTGSSNGKPRKAKTHNNMERMRRIDLRNSFDTLKKLVPPLSKANKCSKVEILKSATEYINALKLMEKRILREEYALKSRNESLRSRLAHLSSN